ncbi:MAG: response regulator [Polyangiaceae bacterium]
MSGPASDPFGPLVLVVDDEPQLRKFLRAALLSHGYRLIEAESCAGALVEVKTRNPDVVLLDLGLPDGSGLDLTRTLRQWSKTPIIVISARGREDDKVEALDAGADDYLTKPFGVKELLARIRVALRHVGTLEPDEPVITLGTLAVDLTRHEVRVDGAQQHLTPQEYKLLVYLLNHRGRVLTHRQILKDVWGAAHASQTHYLRVYMAQLRRKLERDPTRPRILLTEPGVGYRVRDDLSEAD